MKCFEGSDDLVGCAVQSSFNWLCIEPFHFWRSHLAYTVSFSVKLPVNIFNAYYWPVNWRWVNMWTARDEFCIWTIAFILN
jgi:hypothetical protein